MATTSSSGLGKTRRQTPNPKTTWLIIQNHFGIHSKNDVILDSFAGSATTGIAAYLLDRKFVGIEEDEAYLLLAKNRLLAIDKTNKITTKQKIRQQISLI